MDKLKLEALKRTFGGSMSQQEIDLLRDAQAFIDFCIENGLSFRSAVGNLAHDANGILAPGDMFERGVFVPKVKGYRRVMSQLAEDAAALGSDPQLQKELGGD